MCVPVIVSPNNTYTRGVIFGCMPSMHQEHRNEMNTLAQVIEQSPTHKQSYLCVAPCSHMFPLILPMVLNSNTFFAPSHTRYLPSTSNLKHAITSLHARLYFFLFSIPHLSTAASCHYNCIETASSVSEQTLVGYM